MSSKNAIVLCALYILASLIGWEGWLNFGYAEAESWYARSGALIILISLYVELKILPEANESVVESQNNKHAITSLKITQGITHMIVIYGTIAWAYGDLYYDWLKEQYMLSFVVFIIWLLFYVGWLTKRELFNSD